MNLPALHFKKIPHIRHLQLSYSLLHHCLAVKRSKGDRVNPLGHMSLTVDHMYYASLETRYNSRKIRCIMFYLWILIYKMGKGRLGERELIFNCTLFLFFAYIYFLICSEFCHTLKWNVLEFTCLPHSDPPSHLPLHPLPPGPPRAPGPSACLMHPAWAGDLFHPW